MPRITVKPMKPDPLDDLLADYAIQRPAAPVPDRFTADVWQTIEQRRRPFGLSNLVGLKWSELFREPRLALCALAIAMVTAMIPAVSEHSASEQQLARESLHFEVFSPDIASVLPSGARAAQK